MVPESTADKVREAQVKARDAALELTRAVDRIKEAYRRVNDVGDLEFSSALRECNASLEAAATAAQRALTLAAAYEVIVRENPALCEAAVLLAATHAVQRARFLVDQLEAAVSRDRLGTEEPS